jgi:ribose 5-phosphate isomerase B
MDRSLQRGNVSLEYETRADARWRIWSRVASNLPRRFPMKIAVSTDERTHLVDVILAELAQRGHEVIYVGPETGETADWPVVTLQAVEPVATGEADEAIVMCWTGTGCTIIANKVPGIRAALCQDAPSAQGARIWNHANVLGLSLRLTTEGVAKEILDAWFATPYSVDEWNRRQIQRISDVEQQYQPEDRTDRVAEE